MRLPTPSISIEKLFSPTLWKSENRILKLWNFSFRASKIHCWFFRLFCNRCVYVRSSSAFRTPGSFSMFGEYSRSCGHSDQICLEDVHRSVQVLLTEEPVVHSHRFPLGLWSSKFSKILHHLPIEDHRRSKARQVIRKFKANDLSISIFRP